MCPPNETEQEAEVHLSALKGEEGGCIRAEGGLLQEASLSVSTDH